MNSKQRTFLKKKAHNLEPIVRVGKEGLGPTIIDSILAAIDSRELIKLKILQNCEMPKEEIFEKLSEVKDFEVVAMTGRIIIIYKENKDKPTISLELKELR